MRTDLIRAALASAIVSLVVVVNPMHLAASAPDPTEPPAEEPAPEEPAPEEPADTQPIDGEEAAPEPGEVSAAVWVGVIALVAIAVIWAVRQSTRSSSSQEP